MSYLQPTVQNKPPLATFTGNNKTVYYRADKSLLEDGQVVDYSVPAKLVYQIAANYLFGDTGSGTMHVTFADGSHINLAVNPTDIGVASAMLPYNDQLAHQPIELSCTVCDATIPQDQAYWYAAPNSNSYTGIPHVVPVCPSCHADPTSWLPPAYNAPEYLAQRPCERLASDTN